MRNRLNTIQEDTLKTLLDTLSPMSTIPQKGTMGIVSLAMTGTRDHAVTTILCSGARDGIGRPMRYVLRDRVSPTVSPYSNMIDLWVGVHGSVYAMPGRYFGISQKGAMRQGHYPLFKGGVRHG